MSSNNEFGRENVCLDAPFLNIEYDLVRDAICDEPLSSLRNIALRKIAVAFCQQNCIKKKISHSPSAVDLLAFINFGCSYEEWQQQVSDGLQESLPLLIPKYYENELTPMIINMGEQIKMYLLSLQKLKLPFNAKKVKLYLDNIHWTWQGRMNFAKTASSLVQSSDLSTIEKYSLACNYCLSDKIHDLMEMLPKNFINNFIKSENFRGMVFWTLHLTGQDKKFMKCVSRDSEFNHSKYTYVMEWAIKEENEVTVQYFWENFHDDVEIRFDIVELVEVAFDFDCPGNILFYLLTQVTQPQDIEYLCIEDGYEILQQFVMDRRWRGYFSSVSKHILSHVKNMGFSRALKTVVVCWKENISEREEYKRLVKELARNFEIDIKVDFIFSSEAILNLILSIREIGSRIEFLNIGSIEEGRQFLYNDIVRKEWVELIIYKFNVLELLMEDFLITEEEITKYKKYFVEKACTEVAISSIEDGEYKAFEDFLLAFCEKDEIGSIKKNLPFEGQGKIIGDILGEENRADDNAKAMVDKFLNWCFEKRKKEISACKAVLFNPEIDSFSYCHQRFLNRLCESVRIRNTNCVENFLKWAFAEGVSIHQFKRKVVSEILISKTNIELLLNLIYGERNLSSFKRFLDIFFTKKDIKALKEEIKYQKVSDQFLLVGVLLQEENLIQADNILDWCFSSNKDKIAKYKESIMHSIGSEVIFLELIRVKVDYMFIDNVIDWFDLSKSVEQSFINWFLVEFIPTKKEDYLLQLPVPVSDDTSWERFLDGVDSYFCELDLRTNTENMKGAEDKVLSGLHSF